MKIRAEVSGGLLPYRVSAAGLSAISVVIALVAWIGVDQASAQVLYGSLVGNVTDPNGAAIPAALVTATEQNTGIAKDTKTDSGGGYQFVDLQPGTYRLRVSVSGFKTMERPDIPVALNTVMRADAVLEVGNVQQEIT